MSARSRIETAEVAQAVEMYVDSELADAVKFTNRTPLDESGIWSLHALAAEIYAAGWADAEHVVTARERGRARRFLEAKQAPPGQVGEDL